ncbi:hypothetical protein L208DRAFT_1387738 [Tricholoma matsutake]|nr:hypothetical protein L208DRAFT_1387738 [Tricholoma matsutake 945]
MDDSMASNQSDDAYDRGINRWSKIHLLLARRANGIVIGGQSRKVVLGVLHEGGPRVSMPSTKIDFRDGYS